MPRLARPVIRNPFDVRFWRPVILVKQHLIRMQITIDNRIVAVFSRKTISFDDASNKLPSPRSGYRNGTFLCGTSDGDMVEVVDLVDLLFHHGIRDRWDIPTRSRANGMEGSIGTLAEMRRVGVEKKSKIYLRELGCPEKSLVQGTQRTLASHERTMMATAVPFS
jgi:hypothetical protein